MDLLRHLRYFVAVAEELHFGRAAERLHVSQPPLSQRIRALERRAGGPLLERTSRSVTLTPLGRRLLPQARALVEQADELEAALDSLAGMVPAELRVGLPPDTPPAVVGALLRAAEIEIVQGTPAELEAALRTGAVVAAVLRHPLPADVVAGEPLERANGVLLAAESPPATAEVVEPLALDGLELVAPPRTAGAAQHDALLTELGAYGWTPIAVRAAVGADATAGVVLAGGAVALTSRAGDAVDGLVWRPLADGVARVRVSVARRRAATEAELEMAALIERLFVDTDGWTRVPRATTGPPRPRPTSGLPW